MQEILVAEFKNTDDKLHYAIIGMTSIEKEDDDILIKTLDPEKYFRINEESIKANELSIHIYYPNEGDVEKLLANVDMFKHGLQIVDGRIVE